MAWDLWSSSFDQVSYDDDYTEILQWNCDYFGCGHDEIEEDALNVESCVQVLKSLISKADTEIEELEKDLLCLQNELACTEHENWPEICCSALTERINRLDVVVTTLKSDHAEDTEMQLLLHSKPAETIHEIVKALRQDHRQDTHVQRLDESILNQIVSVTEHAPDTDSNNIDSNDVIEKEEYIGTSENSKRSELISELHEKRSDDPDKTEEENTTLKENVCSDDYRLAIMKGSSKLMTTDSGQILNPFSSKGNGNIPSETKGRNITVKENVSSDDHKLAIIKRSQLITKNTCQILNQLSSKEYGNIPSEAKEENMNLNGTMCLDDYGLAIIKRNQLITTESGQILNPFFFKRNKNIPSETKEVNATVNENVCSDDHIKGSQLIAKNACQILNPFLSEGNENMASEAKEQNMNLEGNVCADDYKLAIIEGTQMYCHSRFDTGQQEESENSDLAKKLCDFAPKTARRACKEDSKVAPFEDLDSTCNFVLKTAQRACRKESKVVPVEDLEYTCSFVPKTARRACKKKSKVAPFEDLESMNVPLQILYPPKSCFADMESSTFKENNGNNAPQVIKSEKVTLNSENSALISLRGMQKKNGPYSRLQPTDEEIPRAQDLKSKTAVNFSKSNKRLPSELKSQGKRKPELETCSAIPSTSKNLSTKRWQKSKTCTAGTILNEPITSNAIVPYDSDYVSTKRKLKPENFTAGTIINEPMNNAIVLYDHDFSDLQKKRRVSKLSITLDEQISNVNYLAMTNSDFSAENLMKKKMVELKSMARHHKIKQYYKLPKATLIEELVKQFSSC